MLNPANQNLRVLEWAADGETISGKIVAALKDKPAGTLVNLKASTLGADPPELELASDIDAFLLLTDTVDAGATDFEKRYWGDYVQPPVEVGKIATARKARLIEVEGTALIDEATSGYALSDSTPVGTYVGAKGGKFALAQDEKDVLFRVEANLAAKNGGNFRLRLRRVEFQKPTPA